MAAPLWANFEVARLANGVQQALNGNNSLRLFSNVFAPTPGSVLADFRECVFGGYAALSTLNMFPTATIVQDGQWELVGPTVMFSCTGPPGDNIAGWFISRSGQLVACEAFATAIAIITGQQYQLQLRPQVYSQSIL